MSEGDSFACLSGLQKKRYLFKYFSSRLNVPQETIAMSANDTLFIFMPPLPYGL